jgi:very-short-patch-repair endonuclease
VPELKLAIEIDGNSHDGEQAQVYDAERQAFLESKGTYFLRFTNQQVYEELDAVIEAIAQRVIQLRVDATPPQPSPCKGEGAGKPPFPRGVGG